MMLKKMVGLLCLGLVISIAVACSNQEESKTNPSSSPSEESKTNQWSSPPEMTIDQNKSYQAEVSTTLGNFVIELFAKETPVTVNNFIFLANERFYEKVTFHRIIKTFMIQSGDPSGTGAGGPGYRFADELDRGFQYEIGTVAMANAGPNTNGSQFFICTGEDCAGLNQIPNYTIFGKVISGMDTIEKIASTPVEANAQTGEMSSPMNPVIINKVSITEK